jgi:DNA-binding CsgD family transcriptional regulator
VSARDENLRQACGLRKDTGDGTQPPAGESTQSTRTETPTGRVPASEPLTDSVLKEIRTAGLVLPRSPYPYQPWVPRPGAEEHLLREAQRLEKFRRALLGEVGWLRHERAVRAARRERIAAAARTGQRVLAPARTAGQASDCPLTAEQLTVLAAAAAGESQQDTSRRLLIPYDTIRSRSKSAVARLAARSTTHAVAIAVAAGWITGEQITGGVTP